MSTEPCNTCPECIEITAGTSTDVFEIDGASNTGVDDIRELRENIRYLPSHSRYKIFIIDEVHMLSTSAFNALLKTLEEPPPHVKFIFATTEPHKVPITILSRCQRFDFKRIPMAKVMARLRDIAGNEAIEISDGALAMIARKGDGSMRDSLSVFDQVLAYCGNAVSDDDAASLIGVVDRRLLAEVSAAAAAGDVHRVLAGIRQVDMIGYSMRQFCQELIGHYRNLLFVSSVTTAEDLLDLAESELLELKRQASGFKSRDVERCLSILLKAETEMSFGTFPRLILEMALIRMATLEPVIPIQELLDRVQQIETAAVHTPPLPWNASPQQAKRDVPLSLNDKESPTQKVSQHRGDAHHPSAWERFVEFVKGKSPALGSLLEHGSPLKNTPDQLHIGFPDGSYFLTSMKDPDSIASLTAFAREYNSQETDVRVVTINQTRSSNEEAPPSLEEKKKIDRDRRIDELREGFMTHPAVQTALRVFGGELTNLVDYKEDSR